MKELTVGIDIGGTNTKFGVVDREGKVYHQANIVTTDYNEFNDFFDAMSDSLREAIQFLPEEAQIVGIGIGAANGNYYKAIARNVCILTSIFFSVIGLVLIGKDCAL